MRRPAAVRRPKLLVGALAVLVAVPLASWQAPAQAADPVDTVTTLDVTPPDPDIGDPLQVVATVVRADHQLTDVLGQVTFSVAPSAADLWENDVRFGPDPLTQGVGSADIDLDETDLPFLDDEPDAVFLSARYEPVDGNTSYSDDFVDSQSETVCIDLSGTGCDPAATTTTVVTGPASVLVGQAAQFTATVTPSGAAGTVQFTVDEVPVGSPVSLVSGQAHFSYTWPSAGLSTVRAEFTPSDAGAYGASEDLAGQDVTVTATPPPSPTATATVVGGPGAATVGTPVTFTASVSPASAAGSVQFSVGGAPAGGPVPVAAGMASFSHTFASAGASTVGATFTPADPATYLGSSDATGLAVAVGKTTTTVAVSGPDRVTAGAEAALTATVTPADIPGRVSFQVDGRTIKTVAVSEGTAVIAHRFLSMKRSQVTATWMPSETEVYESSIAPTHEVVVEAGTTAAEFDTFMQVSMADLVDRMSFTVSCDEERGAAARNETVYSLLFMLNGVIFDAMRSAFDSLTLTFEAVLCGTGRNARAQTVEGAVECLLTDEGLQCPLDTAALSRITFTGSLPVPADLAGEAVEIGSSLSLVDPETGELTTLASDQTTARVPERTVVAAALAPVPEGMTYAAHSDSVTYRLRVRNAGVVAADHVQACLKVGKGSSVLVAKGADVRGRRACWTLPGLAAGTSAIRKLTLVTPTYGRAVTVTGDVAPRRSQADSVHLAVRLPLT